MNKFILKKHNKKKHLSRRGTILLFERLYLYLSVDIPIVNALKLSFDINNNKGKFIAHICTDIESGKGIAESFLAHIDISKNIYNLIRQGEISGNLPESMKMIKDLLEKEEAIYKKLISAMIYPAMIGAFTLILTIGLIRGVIPQIVPLLESLGSDLPILTKIIISISNIIVNYGLYIFFSIFIINILLWFIYSRFIGFRIIIHNTLARIPIMGKILLRYHISKFLRSLGVLIRSSLPIIQSYRMSCSQIDFLFLNRIFPCALPKLESGESLSSIMLHKNIPKHIHPLVRAGELSGTLSLSLIRSSDIIDDDLDNALRRISTMIEPAMMIFIGIVVGAIALSIMIPIYDISKVIQAVR